MCIYNLQPTNLIAGTFLNPPLSSPIQKIKRSRSHRAWYKTCYVHNARERKKKGCVLRKAELTIASVGVCLVPPISTNPFLSGTSSRSLGWAAAAMQCAGLTGLGHWSCCGWTGQGKAPCGQHRNPALASPGTLVWASSNQVTSQSFDTGGELQWKQWMHINEKYLENSLIIPPPYKYWHLRDSELKAPHVVSVHDE